MTVLMIPESVQAGLKRIKEFGDRRENWNDLDRVDSGEQALPSDDRHMLFIPTPCGHAYKVVYTTDFDPKTNHAMQHMSVSLSIEGKKPTAVVVATIAAEMGLRRPAVISEYEEGVLHFIADLPKVEPCQERENRP